MRAMYRWAASEGDGDDDQVPKHLVSDGFQERIDDPDEDALPSFVDDCIKLFQSAKGAKTRARAALRVGLAIAVHCTVVKAPEYEKICDSMVEHQALLSSELRYLNAGGTSSHASAFAFQKQAPDMSSASWRPKINFSCRCLDDVRKISKDVFTRDVITCVLSYCDAKTVMAARIVSKEWAAAEACSSDVIWKHSFLAKWQDALENPSGFKLRYMTRIVQERSRKVPLGKKTPPKPVFCPKCDRLFSTTRHVSQHSCDVGSSVNLRKKLLKRMASATATAITKD